MKLIIGERGSGKTERILELANEYNGTVVMFNGTLRDYYEKNLNKYRYVRGIITVKDLIKDDYKDEYGLLFFDECREYTLSCLQKIDNSNIGAIVINDIIGNDLEDSNIEILKSPIGSGYEKHIYTIRGMNTIFKIKEKEKDN